MMEAHEQGYERMKQKVVLGSAYLGPVEYYTKLLPTAMYGLSVLIIT